MTKLSKQRIGALVAEALNISGHDVLYIPEEQGDAARTSDDIFQLVTQEVVAAIDKIEAEDAARNQRSPDSQDVFPSTIITPAGTLRVMSDTDGDYPGYDILIDGAVAAAVEWHPVHQAIVIRSYKKTDENPQHYHRWDGTPVDNT